MESLKITCREMPAFNAGNLEEVRRAFQPATPCEMRQTWLPKPDSDFAPGIVRTGWRGDSLFVFAELTDADIFTRATAHNQRFWELGDTFEIFLRPANQSTYIELHVAPNNLRLQLRIPDTATLRQAQKDNKFEHLLVHEPIFRHHAWTESGRWFVLAEVPSASATGKSESLAGAEWLFSFSRYDCTRGRKDPVFSSTSPHPKADFHSQAEWGTLKFEA